MAKQDYYEVLGVPRNASKDELKKAYGLRALPILGDARCSEPGGRVQV
jgi:hypothetical protein